ncbi:hypothetical protein AMJ47_00315 [Parcubacteria bacterium DG_72]|nr:MAG: hypothetical protein AMJ47_00315 [Parcubacteria bacterium DG_72]
MKIKELLLQNKTFKQIIIKNLSWLFLSEIITRFLTAILTIFIARILGAQDYGFLAFAISFTGFFIIIKNFCYDEIVIREYNQREEVKKELGSILWFKIFLGISAFSLILIFSFLAGNQSVQRLIIIFGVVVLLKSIFEFLTSLFKALHKMEYVALVNILEIIILSGTIFYILFYAPNLIFISYAYLAAAILSLLCSIFIAKRLKVLSQPVLDLKVIKNYFLLSWPLAIGSIFAIIYIQIDSIMMGFLGMTKEVGWYQAAYKITSFVTFPGAIIASVFYPSISKFYKENKDYFKRITNIFLESIAFFTFPAVVGGYILKKKIIFFIYGESFSPSVFAFQFLIFCSGYILFIIFMNYILNATGRQKIIFYTGGAGAALNLVLNIILIPRYSLYGAAVATFFTYSLLFILRLAAVKKIKNSFDFKVILPSFLAVAVMGIFLYSGLLTSYNLMVQIIVAGLVYFCVFLLIKKIKKNGKRF